MLIPILRAAEVSKSQRCNSRSVPCQFDCVSIHCGSAKGDISTEHDMSFGAVRGLGAEYPWWFKPVRYITHVIMFGTIGAGACALIQRYPKGNLPMFFRVWWSAFPSSLWWIATTDPCLRLRFRCANADLSRSVSSWSGHGAPTKLQPSWGFLWRVYNCYTGVNLR